LIDMTYKIISFDDKTAQITVRFADSVRLIDLPIDVNGRVLSGDELKAYLVGFIPTWHYERLDRIAEGITNADEIHALVEPEPDGPFIEQDYLPFPNPKFEESSDMVISTMLRLADVSPADTVIDLGCGNGKILIEAAKLGASAIGYDINSNLLTEAAQAAATAGVVIDLRESDLFTADLSGGTVVTLFLNRDSMELLGPKLARLPSGTRIVSNTHTISWWKPTSVINEGFSLIYLWIVP
jgi:hypothetical protein